MKKIIVFIYLLFVLTVIPVSAQGMMGRFFNSQTTPTDQTSTAQDEAKGKEVFDKFQSKQATCQQLTDDDFDVLGDYYMGQMAGSTAAHAQMNNRMTQMMGDNAEKQMHIALGKRLSGCNTQAAYSGDSNSGFAPMMGYGGAAGWGMMNYFNGGSGYGWMPILIFWLPLIILVVIFIKWMMGRKK